MADETLPPTEAAGTDLPAEGGAEGSQTEAGSGASQPPQPSVEDLQRENEELKKRFSGSTREWQREKARADQREQELAQYQRWAAAQQQQQPQQPQNVEGLTPEEAQDYASALFAVDGTKISQYEKLKADRAKRAAKQEIYQELGQISYGVQRESSLINFVNNQQGLKDANSPFAQTVMEEYNAVLADPLYSFVDRTPDKTGQFYPSVLALAVERAKGKTATQVGASQERERSNASNFVEPSSGGRSTMPGQQPKSAKPDLDKLLTSEEKSFIKDYGRGYTPQKYWDNLSPWEKDQSLKAGKPVRKGR